MSVSNRIESAIGKRVLDTRPLHGGMIAQVYLAQLENNRKIVAKVSESNNSTLDIEGYMLRYLGEYSSLPVPTVLHSSKHLLLMTFIEGSSHLSKSEHQHAAELLANLHSISAEQFGLERDTLIGPLHQPNTQCDSWIAFFRDYRLLYMAKVAYDHGALPRPLFSRIEKFASQLESWLLEPEHPSLVHGDMWTTNILGHNGRITGFVDPAIYYGHAEIELAYSTLFGTFGDVFFERYNSIRPIVPGFFEERRDIYNLYPLLVHVRLFGGGYVSSVDNSLRRFGF